MNFLTNYHHNPPHTRSLQSLQKGARDSIMANKNIITSDAFKKRFVDFKRRFSETTEITDIIVNYFTHVISKETCNFPLMKLVSYTHIPTLIQSSDINQHTVRERQRSCGGIINPHSIKYRSSQMNMAFSSRNYRALTMVLTFYYSDFCLTVNPNYVVNGMGHNLAYQVNEMYNTANNYSSIYKSADEMFTRVCYSQLVNLVPYIYEELCKRIKNFFGYSIDDPSIKVHLYKCYNRNNEIFTQTLSRMLINEIIYQPFLHFFHNGTICHYDDQSNISYGYGRTIYNYTFFPCIRRIYCSNNIPEQNIYYTYNDKHMRCFSTVTNGRADQAVDYIDDSIIGDMMADGTINETIHLGNLLNNLYINIEDGSDSINSGIKYYLIEYNKSGASKKMINNVLNVGEVISYNIKNHREMIPANILTEMSELKSQYKSHMDKASWSVSNHIDEFRMRLIKKYVTDVYMKTLVNNKMFVDIENDLIYKNIIQSDTKNPVGMYDVTLAAYSGGKMRPYGTIDKRFKITFCLQYIMFSSTHNNYITIRNPILVTDIHPEDTCADMIVDSSQINLDAIKLFIKNQSDSKNTITYKEFDSYYMKISYYVYAMLHGIKEVILPFAYEYYIDNIDKIFDVNDKNFVLCKKYYRQCTTLYNKYVKRPTLEENNQSDKDVNLECRSFMTQLSYYSAHFDMNVIDLGDYNVDAR